MKPKTIQIFLQDGSPIGIRISEITNRLVIQTSSSSSKLHLTFNQSYQSCFFLDPQGTRSEQNKTSLKLLLQYQPINLVFY